MEGEGGGGGWRGRVLRGGEKRIDVCGKRAGNVVRVERACDEDDKAARDRGRQAGIISYIWRCHLLC